MTDKSDRHDGAVQAGMILQIGGASPGQGWGMNAIEVREASDAVGWRWRTITNDERQKLIDALNAAPTRDGAEEAEDDFGDMPSAYLVARATPPAVAAEPVATPQQVQEACAQVADRASQQDEEYAAKYPDEAHKFDQRAHRAKTIAISIRALIPASPSVRGDREILRDAIMGAAKLHTHDHALALKIANDAILSFPVQPVAPRLPQDTLDRLVMLNVSKEEVYEVLKKHLSADMIDGIWQEIKEAGRSDAGERPSSEAILAQCDELHDLGFNDGWNGAVEECAKVAEQGLTAFSSLEIARAIRTLARQPHTPTASPNSDR